MLEGNNTKFLWSNCNHEYCRECAMKYITPQLNVINFDNKDECHLLCLCEQKMTMYDLLEIGLTKLCSNCKYPLPNHLISKWFNCDHEYCQQCMSLIINQSLSSFN